MIDVLVTGAKGQLAKTIALFKDENSSFNFIFKSKEELDIVNKSAIVSVFNAHNFRFCINCAAYTNVEQAEKTPEIAYKINGEAVKNLAEVCSNFEVKLIHISTDYVFDGETSEPYKENEIPNPLNEYGKSKLQGERYIQDILNSYYIIRVSWLYSAFEKNFFNTIANYLNKNQKLNITTSQRGTPTSCVSLAQYIIWMLASDLEYGVYHFTDEGKNPHRPTATRTGSPWPVMASSVPMAIASTHRGSATQRPTATGARTRSTATRPALGTPVVTAPAFRPTGCATTSSTVSTHRTNRRAG